MNTNIIGLSHKSVTAPVSIIYQELDGLVVLVSPSFFLATAKVGNFTEPQATRTVHAFINDCQYLVQSVDAFFENL